MSGSTSWHRILLGILLIALGIGFLVENVTDYDVDWGDWWPVILIVVGVMKVASSRWLGVLLVLLGTAFLVDNLDIFDLDIGDYWPVALVIAGLALIFGGLTRRRQREKVPSGDTSSSDFLDVSSAFGGIDHRVTSQQFRGGKVSTTLGGGTIDLRGAALADNEATLHVDTVLGGVEILVPDEWMVNVQVTGTFGGVDVERSQPSAPAATLTLTGSCTLGGITVK